MDLVQHAHASRNVYISMLQQYVTCNAYFPQAVPGCLPLCTGKSTLT